MAEKTPSFVWHPAVHYTFGQETLHYLFLEVRSYAPSFLQHVREIFVSEGIIGFCLYEVFGAEDVLVRVWAREDKFERAVRNLLGHPDCLALARLQVQHMGIKYLWAEGFTFSDDEYEELQSLLVSLSQEDLQEIRDTPREDWGLLDGGDIAPRLVVGDISSQNSTQNTLKFFVVLSLDRPPGRSIDKICDRVLELAVAADLQRPSLYVLVGMRSFLIKATTTSVHCVREFVLSLLGEYEASAARSRTYIAADLNAHESDDVDFTYPWAHREKAAFFEFLGLNPSSIDNMAHDTRKVFLEMFHEAREREALTRDSYGVLANIFRAYAEGNATMLQSQVWIFYELEGRLRVAFPQIIKYAYGYDDSSWVRSVLPDLLPSAGLDPENHSWKQLKNVLALQQITNMLAKADKATEGAVSALIKTEDWKSRLIQIAEVRNDIFHGHLNNAVILERWRDIVTAVMEVLLILDALTRLDEHPTSK